jgi:hypothetical protein
VEQIDTPAPPRDAHPGGSGVRVRVLQFIAAISGIYDLALGLTLSVGRPLLMQVFALPSPSPAIHADLNALFAIVIGLGYSLPYRDPVRYRAYLWLMGPLLKGAGAVTFVLDYALRGSPASFLLLAAADGSIAALTLWGLVRTRR